MEIIWKSPTDNLARVLLCAVQLKQFYWERLLSEEMKQVNTHELGKETPFLQTPSVSD